jgi:hypothetical protein
MAPLVVRITDRPQVERPLWAKRVYPYDVELSKCTVYDNSLPNMVASYSKGPAGAYWEAHALELPRCSIQMRRLSNARRNLTSAFYLFKAS